MTAAYIAETAFSWDIIMITKTLRMLPLRRVTRDDVFQHMKGCGAIERGYKGTRRESTVA